GLFLIKSPEKLLTGMLLYFMTIGHRPPFFPASSEKNKRVDVRCRLFTANKKGCPLFGQPVA
ncbi:hypothetical protein, partial [Geobacillus stearothermophilus]|uniref:hypothetical protein n=1 Tax=Geobacillus stearothermophilus TaxID=1422 RepID=UPI001F3A10F7